MKRIVGALATALVALMTIAVAGAVAGGRPTDGAPAAGIDTGTALVQLNGEPLSTYVKTKPAPGKKIDFASSATKSYRAQLSALRNDFKQWLKANAPAAQVTGEFDIGLNAVSVNLNGTPLSTIAAAPMVTAAEYESVYTPAAADPDLAVIGAVTAWGAGGAPNAGKGVKVGIVDTGIDITHPCFSDAGFPATKQLGDTRFTNNKVIVARVFNNRIPTQHFTPEALQEHGTHVSGTVACDFQTPTNADGISVPYAMSGVAPAAQLGNYNVFPGGVTNARSEDIFKALESAYADGMDIVNMSLGGGSHGEQDLLMAEVNHLDEAGMISAVAAGNSGPGFFSAESPGAAARALTAGAATVGHYIATPVAVGAAKAQAAAGAFPKVSADLTKPLGVVTGTTNGLSTSCNANKPAAGSLTGKIALVSRGACTFSEKIRNAQDAGAEAVLVANNVGGDPIAMGRGGIPNEPTVPAYMVSLADGQTLKGLDGKAATISATRSYFLSGNNDIMAGFSSRGPTDVDFRVKPDVVAPGVNVLSSIPYQFCAAPPCFAFFQGTSMATPHLAGSAAVVLSQRPWLSAEQVRSSIVNTADQGVLKSSTNGTSPVSDVQIVGAGRENLASAVGSKVALGPVSVSFGAVPNTSGQTQTATVTVTNLTTAAQTLTPSISAGDSSVAFSTGGPLTLAAGASSTVSVTMDATKTAKLGRHQGTLTLSSRGAPVAHAAVFVFFK